MLTRDEWLKMWDAMVWLESWLGGMAMNRNAAQRVKLIKDLIQSVIGQME